MESERMEKLRKLQNEHYKLQQRIWRLEDVILANERNLGKGKFEGRKDLEKIIKSYKRDRLENNLERFNLVHGDTE